MIETAPVPDHCMADGDIHIRTSRRARRLRIDVTARKGVVVVAPAGTPAEAINRFVLEKRDWIRRARNRVAAEAAASAPADAAALPDRLELRALDRRLPVQTVPADRRRIIDAGDHLRVEGVTDPADTRAQLERWLKAEAKRALVPRLDELARDHDLRFERTAVRGQRTRWASCSGRGTISLNFRLLFLPWRLVEHVMLHELAHTRHLNHSRHFWALLARLDPDWRHHHDELRDARRWVPAWVEMD
jgi:predicted metal-dependent hydrolase